MKSVVAPRCAARRAYGPLLTPHWMHSTDPRPDTPVRRQPHRLVWMTTQTGALHIVSGENLGVEEPVEAPLLSVMASAQLPWLGAVAKAAHFVAAKQRHGTRTDRQLLSGGEAVLCWFCRPL